MQLLDVSFPDSNLARTEPDKNCNTLEIGGRFGAAYSRAASIETAANGFKKLAYIQ
jgi:hypothetical protein